MELRVSSYLPSLRLRFAVSRNICMGCLTWLRIGQVIAPLLIIQRVANRSALTSDTIVTGHIISFHDRGRGESVGGLPHVPSVSSADNGTKNAAELGDHRVEAKIDLHQRGEA